MYAILDLFSGIGGFSLGLHRASDKFYTTAFCEIEDFCQAVLKKNFKNIHIFKDVKELNEKTLKAAGAVKPFIISGGYPCQPFSVAGKRKGKDDPRNIWSEMFRLIKELKPVWVLAENVEGHIKLGLDEVLYDLESQNYTTQTFIIPATGVGANHQRKRLWIVGYSKYNGSLAAKKQGNINTTGNNNKKRKNKTIKFERTSLRRNNENMAHTKFKRLERFNQKSSTISRQDKRTQFRNESSSGNVAHSNSRLCRGGRTITPSGKNEIRGVYSSEEKQKEQHIRSKTIRCNSIRGKADVAHSDSKRQQEQCRTKPNEKKKMRFECESSNVGENWNIEPNVGRVANGISFRVDRLKAIGNSIVPQIAEIIGKAIITQEEE